MIEQLCVILDISQEDLEVLPQIALIANFRKFSP